MIACCAALHLAVLLPTASSWAEGRAAAGAISLAVADANQKFPVKLSYVWKEVDCRSADAAAAISRMLQDDIVDGVIGPDCETSCESSAYLTAGRDLAQISYSCCSDLLSNKKKYPTVSQPGRHRFHPFPDDVCLGASSTTLLELWADPQLGSSVSRPVQLVSRSCAVLAYDVELLELDARHRGLCKKLRLEASLTLISPRHARVHSDGTLPRIR
jgi:hypothetical protein